MITRSEFKFEIGPFKGRHVSGQTLPTFEISWENNNGKPFKEGSSKKKIINMEARNDGDSHYVYCSLRFDRTTRKEQQATILFKFKNQEINMKLEVTGKEFINVVTSNKILTFNVAKKKTQKMKSIDMNEDSLNMEDYLQYEYLFSDDH